MSLLEEAVNQTAYLKAGIMGFAGSGKTRTATELAIGLSKELGDGKPVAFFDTETGSDFMIPLFERAGVKLLRVKRRDFKSLLTFMKEAQEQCSVAIIDSITHVWAEIQDSYKRRKRIEDLQFQDWGVIKREWSAFTDAYVNSPLHVIMCGRAGYEYEYQVNDRGRKELVKTGTKMKAEGELGYEPSLLLEMEREPKPDKDAAGWINRCYVLKDRTDTMNGAVIDYPRYESFRPILSFLAIGGRHLGVETQSTSDDLFDAPQSRENRARLAAIALGEIKEWLIVHKLNGNSAEAQRDRVPVLKAAFGTSAWDAIRMLPVESLSAGLRLLQERGRPAEAPDAGGWVTGEESASPATGAT